MGPIVTTPNVISLVRLALIPVFLWLLFGRDDPVAAAWLFGFIGATDWVDGFLARKLDQVSKVGEFLDPLADRIAVVAALAGGWIHGELPAWFAAAILAREVAFGFGALYIGLKARTKLEVRRLGKLATLLVYAGVGLLFLGFGADIDWLKWAGWAAGIPGLVLYYVVAVSYFTDLRRTVAQVGQYPVMSPGKGAR